MRTIRHQPRLYPNRNFIEQQRWTLDYQQLVRASHNLTTQVITNPSMARQRDLIGEYNKLYDHLNTLIQELPEHLQLHLSMNPEDSKTDWLTDTNNALRTMLSANGMGYDPSICDYVSQPINYLWFGLNTLKRMDEMGRAQDCEKWLNDTSQRRALLNYNPSQLAITEQSIGNPTKKVQESL